MARAAAAGRDVAGAARGADGGQKQGFSQSPTSGATAAAGEEEWNPLMEAGSAESLHEVSLSAMLARPGSGALGNALSSYRSTKLEEVNEVEIEAQALAEPEQLMPYAKGSESSSSESQLTQRGNQSLAPWPGGVEAVSDDGADVQPDLEDSELGGYQHVAVREDNYLSESSIGSSTDITPVAGKAIASEAFSKEPAAPPAPPLPPSGVLAQPHASNVSVDLRPAAGQPSRSSSSSSRVGGEGGSGAPLEVTIPSEQIDLVKLTEAEGRVAGPQQAILAVQSAGSESLDSAAAPSRSWRQFMPQPASFRRGQPAPSLADDRRDIRAALPAAPLAAPQASVPNAPPLPSPPPIASFYVDAGIGSSLVPQFFQGGVPMAASPGHFTSLGGSILRLDQ